MLPTVPSAILSDLSNLILLQKIQLQVKIGSLKSFYTAVKKIIDFQPNAGSVGRQKYQ